MRGTMNIRINNISKAFGEKQVLYHFTAEIKEGITTSVMAPSGAGKTTLLRILSGLEKADEGTVSGLEGKRIGMVFQEDRLCENLNAVSNIRLVCGKNITKNRIEEELGKMGLAGSIHLPVSELSGGMRRRVALVRALLAPCDILLLDEPFQGLDEANKKTVMDDTRQSSMGKTVILVTHDEKEAEYMEDDRLVPVFCQNIKKCI